MLLFPRAYEGNLLDSVSEPFEYLCGFGAAHGSEALKGALPEAQNSPRLPPYGLVAEQLNGTSFTVPRAENRRVWLYRVRPSLVQDDAEPMAHPSFNLDYLDQPPAASPVGWTPRVLPEGGIDFVDGLTTRAGAGDPADARGLALHTFVASSDMGARAMVDADGDLMILPDTGILRLRTELGWLRVEPGELVVIPRGIVFSVFVEQGPVRGVVMEVYARHFRLPERGPIGANGLADERHFFMPVASYEDRAGPFEIVVKMGGHLYRAARSHSPFDVVAWHGNYTPYKYDLRRFNAMGTVTWDHPDPSIFTVLSAPFERPGENLADLVVFPSPRWDVAAHTFRPPYYHRNAATEINAIVAGVSRADDVFSCGGIFITPPFAAHGPNAKAVERAHAMSDEEADEPHELGASSLYIQWESTLALRMAPAALSERQPDFSQFARGVATRFDANKR
jgi:homogentisate 1,2-dioxygenase